MATQLTLEQSLLSGAQGNRSVKDIIAHITAWNINGIEWIRCVRNGERPVLPMEGFSIEERPSRFEQLNKEIHEINQEKPLEQVLSEFSDALQELVCEIALLEETQLDVEYDFEWMDRQIPGWQIVAWRYYHCQSHGKHIEALLEKVP